MEKALEILKEYKNIDYGCDMSDHKERCEEAIKELEEAQLTRREWYQKGYNEAMKPKTCSSCKYWDFNEQGHFKKCFNGKGNVVSTEADFCCNRYERKDTQC